MQELNSRKVRHWMTYGPSSMMGRQVKVDFEKQVLDELVFVED